MIKVILRKKQLSNGEFPIVLRITKDRKSKIFSLGISCKTEFWNSGEVSKRHPKQLVYNRIILKQKMKALSIIDDFRLEDFNYSLNDFSEKFKGSNPNENSVYEFWMDKVNTLQSLQRIGTAKSYKETLSSLMKFYPDKSLMFKDITPRFLERYEVYLRNNGNEDGGIGFKMRALRAIFNDAINKEVVSVSHYPFNRYKISKFKGKGSKIILTRNELKLFENLDTSIHPHLSQTKDYFMFSYYAGGINYMDLMQLTWDNIENGRLKYVRSKTKTLISIKLLKPAKEILEKYRHGPLSYIFPILLKEELTANQIHNRKLKTLRRYNKQLKEIGAIVGINKPISSYTSRKSFATNLKFLGTPVEIISEAMGHKDILVTQAYLREFDTEVIDEALENLLMEAQLEWHNPIKALP